ncbi:tRNA uridine-5-carboxymethylaminomethyl(34) synthesis GTPase MnmE [Roseobacter sp. HKCCA0434]|uniref:tRNA uridine-5-carboxymethylaminomethyl(34) synthesis GTPase MnmE n=1 Tax=Roseobacter sp. HKCCA0434 TaxID=3079297 RepID=UPI002905DFBB|nr:tRNA uridine-5-carboxymethylaminomethyl(34) synthesis GTPase MnmE [Roseobacter sp. HKCCA0434]
MDTIYAPATAPGRAGVGILRVSGPQVTEIIDYFCSFPVSERVATLRKLTDGPGGDFIDEALILRFSAGASFTGEDVVEFQHHGSLAVSQRLQQILAMRPGVRLAERGEFTRRAVENGRLDLIQAEGLLDLIEADTEMQRRQALEVFGGGLSSLAKEWREQLLRAIALVEATIDFSEEEIPSGLEDQVSAILTSLIAAIDKQLAGASAAQRVREGFEVAIVGRPNVGKSTLLNALGRREIALTSDIAGTTRDVIEVPLQIEGQLVNILDTAGLRSAEDRVEQMGVDLARRRANAADLRIFLLAPGQDHIDENAGVMVHQDDIVLQGQDDDGSRGGVSGRTGAGLDSLLNEIGLRAAQCQREASFVIRDRQRIKLETGLKALHAAQSGLGEIDIELVAEDLRHCSVALDGLIGYIGPESILGEIFSSFCIGK